MKNHIPRRQVWQQLKADLIGKDSYRGVTLSYTWLANQFGHVSLGFIPTFIVYLVFVRQGYFNNPGLAAPLCVSAAWLLFETYNFLGPLLIQKHSKSKLLYVPGKSYTFQPDWKNVAFDTATDLGFFWFGAFFAASLCSPHTLQLFSLLAIALLLVWPSIYWYPTKIFLQAAQYPYQLRLAQWDLQMADDDQQTVLRFLQEGDGHHLFIFGGRRCGKTSLAVGIATELSIYHHTAVYTTAIKLYNQFFENRQQTRLDDGGYWSWRNSSLLVIDDINPGDPINTDLVSPQLFQSYIDTFSINQQNREVISNLKIIWVMGSDGDTRANLANWSAMLAGIGVETSRILSVNLPGN